jgi:glyoxylase-like metal-dependent hydrolase (beta-lactamase superfamily II)
MKKIDVTPAVVQLTRFGFINCFLVLEPDGWTLVDTGLKGSGKAIRDAAHKLPIRQILLTHAHYDHAGSVDELVAGGGVALATSEREARLLAGDATFSATEEPKKLTIGYMAIEARPRLTLSTGDRVGPFTALETPGHTPGHTAFWDDRDGTLFAGDALMNIGKLHVAGIRYWLNPFSRMATWNPRLALESARRMLALKPQRILFGHGQALDQPVPQLEKAIAEAERDLA